MTWLNLAAFSYLARFCLVILFPFSALDKVINYKEALAQATSSWLPGGRVLLILAIVVETLAPLCILTAWHDRFAAFILAGFCAITAVLYHPFWLFKDFWVKGDSVARNHFWDFLKNFGLVGGLLLLMQMSALLPADVLLNHPMSAAPSAALQP